MNLAFRKVLVVDDCPVTLARLSKELQTAGFIVTTATNGADALAEIQNACPDYVITDWRMPILDGQMLCQCIRSGEKINQYVYVILMTAHSELMDLADGLGTGADDYITKPIDIRELIARMKNGSRILELDRRLSHAASHDPLTGMLNRRTMFSTMNNLIEVCERKSMPVACIMVDIDNFKTINDKYGHPYGDQILIQVAECLAVRFRQADFVCRYGGEEFAIVLPECSEAGAAACAERCREDLQHLSFLANGNERFNVTASFGCAVLDKNGTSAELIDLADKALLKAKSNGRDQVVRFSELTTLGSNEANIVPINQAMA